ncbi:MAG: DUF58 domain-containing protein [Gammaproteobacteria bacterium]|nr:DUF58 domain-containing protein [Gammaproteobacteria bacterium]MCG3146474.1 hypothetical protein [Gammaproteobacteria bacterium]
MASATAAGVRGRAEVSPPPRIAVRVLPNRYGWLMLLVLGVMLLGSINYNNNLGYALTFLLMGVWVMAHVHGYRNLRGIEVLGARATPVFVGEEAVFEVFVCNSSARASHGLAISAGMVTTDMFEVAAGDSHTARLSFPAQRRGVLPLPPVTIASGFPLAIGTARIGWRGEASATVYPHPAGALPLPETDDPAAAAAGYALSGDTDFAGLRAYRTGDSLRQIAWKALARERGLHVKRFAGGVAAQVELRLRDLRFIGDPETQLSQLARWVMDAERAGISYSLDLDHVLLPAGVGEAHREFCLQALAHYGPPS